MNFLTHVLISKTLYQHLSKKMNLDRKAFSYGNIKPDLSPQCLRNPHMLENYLFIIHHESNQLINRNTPVREFSVELGVVCHYICDFFCYCHLNPTLYHKLFHHFFYEIRLHLALCGMLLLHKIKLPSDRKAPARNLPVLVMAMRKEYMTKQKTLQRDIEYAITTSLLACQSIDSSIKNAMNRAAKNAADNTATSEPCSLTASCTPSRG